MSEDTPSEAVSLQDAERTTVAPPKPDRMAVDEEKMFAHEENMQSAQLGWIGRFWGSKAEKPGNVSAIVALLLALYLGALIFFFPDSPVFGDIFAGLTSIITLILGYLFGSSDKS